MFINQGLKITLPNDMLQIEYLNIDTVIPLLTEKQV